MVDWEMHTASIIEIRRSKRSKNSGETHPTPGEATLRGRMFLPEQLRTLVVPGYYACFEATEHLFTLLKL